ncbi:hypothetical protein BC827DRAFT_1265578 [Russula dissimulans]|nr:hypothetical protein BC827DRAFT_1265578 [Russula dissimulans]
MSEDLASQLAASAAVIFYDWFLTSSDEAAFLWRRRRSLFARILFVLARYPAILCSIMDLLPATNRLNDVATILRCTAVISSEVIFATRTWVIWEKSRRIFAFLFLQFILGVVIAAKVPSEITAVGLAPSVIQNTSDLQHCQLLINAVTPLWIIPYIAIIFDQAVMCSLTLYKVLQYHRRVPKQSRSRLLHVIWTDGVMYFIFMLCEDFLPTFLAWSLNRLRVVLGTLNTLLVLGITDLPLRGGISQLQTVFHSVLSTRIALHTASVLKQDIVDERSTSVHYRASRRVEQRVELADAADVTSEEIVIPEGKADVEAQNH